MKTDLLACRHIGVNKADAEVMLRKIGVASLDELIDKTIPANIRLKAPLALPAPMTEYEFARHIAELAGKNKLFTTYSGTDFNALRDGASGDDRQGLREDIFVDKHHVGSRLLLVA